ncbi:MAG TPA: hypothetical protein VJS38_15185 [Phenylobacterium sp.]|uniref:hypothetical protein n=1 Tax=Phenylobacterium sp. TaxID=1871053 RepID=UPI002B4A99A1|nr:hypothetical protein [Phenylobacterium sp.]HKR89515.1 hypothetical protein [Phenylobacterium sp.]
MKLNYLFGAVAACGLIAGAAYAQATSSPPTSDTTSGAAGSVTSPNTPSSGAGAPGDTGSMSGPSSSAAPATSEQAAPSSATAPSDTGSTGVGATSATTYGQGASVTTTTMAMNPVPDTRENREKFGGPNSNAGRRTAPKGN